MGTAPPDLDSLFFALSDPSRRTIIERLARGPAVVGALAEHVAVGATAVSRHLRILEEAGLVTRQVRHRHHVLRLRDDGLAQTERWITDLRQFWTGNVDRLVETVEGLPEDDDA